MGANNDNFLSMFAPRGLYYYFHSFAAMPRSLSSEFLKVMQFLELHGFRFFADNS
jgi:hypothetical protein